MTAAPEDDTPGFSLTVMHDDEGRLLVTVYPISEDREPGASLILVLDIENPNCWDHWRAVASVLDPLMLDEVLIVMRKHVLASLAEMTPAQQAAAHADVAEVMAANGLPAVAAEDLLGLT